VNLTDAYLMRTQLAGANLARATGVTQAQLDDACGSAETKLPPNTTAPKTWPCGEEPD
jgi:uncharacterized protein YjbI with pentapeptide repeats